MADPRRVLVAGDWHGNWHWASKVISRIPQLLAGEQRPLVLQLGDFGIWPGAAGRAFLGRTSRALREADAQLWFVDGNHEDHDQLDRELRCRPKDPPWRDRPVQLEPRIWWLPRGHRWTWHGRRWLALGGATSVDRKARAPGRSWWPQEEITLQQAREVTDAGHADVMVTHDCPAGVPLQLPPPPGWWDIDRANRHRDLLRDVVDVVQPGWLMHGHYHLHVPEREASMSYGPVRVTSLDMDGTPGNWAVLNVETMTWEDPDER